MYFGKTETYLGKYYYGITENALSLVQSYLKDRGQSVKIGEFVSATTPLETGVPQGSVLGPLLFTLFTAPLSGLIRGNGLNTHSYADDSQLYLVMQFNELISEQNRKEKCLCEFRKWMVTNFIR